MRDIREDIVDIVRKYPFYKDDINSDVYCYPDIPDKMYRKFKKHLKADISINEVAVILDSTLLKSGKDGMVFTAAGIYLNQSLMKRAYFNYADIKSITENIYIEVLLQSGEIIEMSCNMSYDKDCLITLLYELQDYASQQGLSSRRDSGLIKKQKKPKMPKDLVVKCNAIIHSAAVSAGGVGAGMAQIPCADSTVITPIQIGMVTALGKVFDLHITDGIAKGIIGGFAGAYIGRGLVQITLGWIPGVGNTINTATASGLTEAIGWAAANQFYAESLYYADSFGIEGEKKGYREASYIYERKLRDQAAEFLKQKENWKNKMAKDRECIENLNTLIDEYEFYICEHQNDENCNIISMEEEYRKLKNLRDIS
ncbi:hypothetical protein AALA98_16500 [Lachnospiraceae bacterium 45-W7]